MIVLAVDPGCDSSAWVLFDGARAMAYGYESNEDLLARLYQGVYGEIATHGANVVFEQIASYGMPVGAEIFQTVLWTGRFYQQAIEMRNRDCRVDLMPRREVKLHLCASARAKDANIRQALIDRFGGKANAVGKKRSPGPLYGIHSHQWAALALAVTWHDLHSGTSVERTA